MVSEVVSLCARVCIYAGKSVVFEVESPLYERALGWGRWVLKELTAATLEVVFRELKRT